MLGPLDLITACLLQQAGRRFSKASIRILKNWLSEHVSHPYPDETERITLQYQTGLSKTQVLNWLANARRRSASSYLTKSNTEILEAKNRGTSQPGQAHNRCPTPQPRSVGTHESHPLRRWVDSPPENEPAKINDIARAMAWDALENSPQEFPNSTEPYIQSGSSSRQENLDTPFDLSSCASNAATSENSASSAQSLCSSGSSDLFLTLGKGRHRRKTRQQPKTPTLTKLLPPKTEVFQCTFCTTTFRKKHDWQRHEKTQHIPLENWICTRFGACFLDVENRLSCVFCGSPEPSDKHLRSHNYLACPVEPPGQSFSSRKDHLSQHLRLVHKVEFFDPSMKHWRVAIEKLRSRCGFCGLQTGTCDDRADHLAQHFKQGHTMADWEGDWGFDPQVLLMVEKALPPYIIDMERNSPFPLRPGDLIETPQSAYDIIKLELVYSIENAWDRVGKIPGDEEIQLEACRIVFAFESSSSSRGVSSSWLRDLLMADQTVMTKAKFGPLRTELESRFSTSIIHGKATLFEACTLEEQLRAFIVTQQLIDNDVQDRELQVEACNIVDGMEKGSDVSSNFFSRWLARLIWSSTSWLFNFRQRTEPMVPWAYGVNIDRFLVDNFSDILPKTNFSTKESYCTRKGAACNQHQGDNQSSLVNDSQQLDSFTGNLNELYSLDESEFPASIMRYNQNESDVTQVTRSMPSQSRGRYDFDETGRPRLLQKQFFFTNDPNFHRWLHRELGRWVASTISINNPANHIPSDEELQHQARWILHENGDPWNQTPADNQEWLKQFKISVGIR